MDVFIHKKSKKRQLRSRYKEYGATVTENINQPISIRQAYMHIFMNGTDYRKAVADQKDGVCDRVIYEHLAEYQKRGITWLREGGDIYGTSWTMELAPAYGITTSDADICHS